MFVLMVGRVVNIVFSFVGELWWSLIDIFCLVFDLLLLFVGVGWLWGFVCIVGFVYELLENNSKNEFCENNWKN